MTINKRSYDSVQPDISEELEREQPTAYLGRAIATGEQAESSRRLNEARGFLFRVEREALQDVEDELHRSEDNVRSLQELAADTLAEAHVIEGQAKARAHALTIQADFESDLAKRIKSDAETQALGMLDRAKDTTDAVLGWVESVAGDISNVMREQAAREAFKKMEDIEAAREAIFDEERAGEILDLAARLRRKAA